MLGLCPRVNARVFCDECGYSRSEAMRANDEDQEGLPHWDMSNTDEVIESLEEACNALNHEDEDFIPAIEFAIAVLKKGSPEA